jgi:hypothetical protein
MKTFRAVSVLFVVASLVLVAVDRQASAGGMYGWSSAGCCGRDGYGYAGYGYGGCCQVYGGYVIGCGYGGCGPGGCGLDQGFWIVGDYTPYVIGHGPMFPAGDFSPSFSYTRITPMDMSVTTPR